MCQIIVAILHDSIKLILLLKTGKQSNLVSVSDRLIWSRRQMQRNKQYLMYVADIWAGSLDNGDVEMFRASSPPISDGSTAPNNQNNERLDYKNTSSMHLGMHLKGYFLTWDLVWVHQIASLSYLVTNVHRNICLLWKHQSLVK